MPRGERVKEWSSDRRDTCFVTHTAQMSYIAARDDQLLAPRRVFGYISSFQSEFLVTSVVTKASYSTSFRDELLWFSRERRFSASLTRSGGQGRFEFKRVEMNGRLTPSSPAISRCVRPDARSLSFNESCSTFRGNGDSSESIPTSVSFVRKFSGP